MMMEYRLAQISFCPDLTDPRAVSMPAAVFVASSTGKIVVSAIAMAEPLPYYDQLTPLAKVFLDKLLKVITTQIDDVCDRLNPEATLDDLMTAFCSSLRNSLHVSRLDVGTPIDLPGGATDETVGSETCRIATHELRSALMAAGYHLSNRGPTHPRRGIDSFTQKFFPLRGFEEQPVYA